jgi:hypothetical protein
LCARPNSIVMPSHLIDATPADDGSPVNVLFLSATSALIIVFAVLLCAKKAASSKDATDDVNLELTVCDKIHLCPYLQLLVVDVCRLLRNQRHRCTVACSSTMYGWREACARSNQPRTVMVVILFCKPPALRLSALATFSQCI